MPVVSWKGYVMIAFFCSTPYAVFTVVSIKAQYFRNEEADLFILDYFSGADTYVERIRVLNSFKNVFHINGWKRYERVIKDVRYPQYDPWKIRMRISHVFWKLFYYGRCNTELKKDHIDPKKYSIVFFSYNDPVCNMIGIYAKRKKLDMLHYGFEDGTRDYSVELDEKYHYIKKLEKIFGVPNNVYYKDKYWMYRPDQIYNKPKYDQMLERIFPPDDNVKAQILRIWDINKTPYRPGRYIFFDNFVEREILLKVIKHILEIVGKSNFTFKRHPRRKDSLFADNEVNIWPVSDIPFEVYLANENYDNRVLISSWSTTCFTPKFIFDQEPIVVFIYRIVETKDKMEEADSMVKKLVSVYEHKERIYIPNDISELCNIIKQINEQ